MDKQSERLKVLGKVYDSIKKRMDIDSVNKYVMAAREYGKTHSIQEQVENWITRGREVFTDSESLKEWVESLP